MSKAAPSWSEEVKRHSKALVALRRDFHRHPELGFAETRTATVIAERLNAAGLEVRTGIAGTGVVGILRGKRPGRTIAWRADIDALPLEEVPELPFKSVHEGTMHACGHDGHTAVAVTMAEILAARRRELSGTAVFIFQPAEEALGGAARMIADDVLEDPQVDQVFGIHLTTLLPAGRVGVRPGPVMASADFFDIEVTGVGGHGAFPHLSHDPITAAAALVSGLQNLVSRELPAQEAAVVTIGQIAAGSGHNIIPEKAVLRGSIRSFQQHIRDQLVERLTAYATRLAQAYQTEARVTLEGENCPAVVNHEAEAALVHRCASEEMGADNVLDPPPVMGSDDMSLFLRERPGCYFWVGAAPEDKQPMPHHHPAFELNEAGLPVGVRMGLKLLLATLGE